MSSESMPTNPPMSNLQESSHLFKAEILQRRFVSERRPSS